MGYLYLHYEEANAPPYTLKLAIGPAPSTVADALSRFATAYGATKHSLSLPALSLSGEDGQCFSATTVLPCGMPAGSDVFVRSSEPPQALSADAAPIAAAAAATAVAAASQPVSFGASASAPSAQPEKGVYAKAGSVVAASQAKMGENSYYYSVGKNRAPTSGPGAPKAHAIPASSTPLPTVSAEAAAPSAAPPAGHAKLPEQTFSSYSMLDEDDFVKVHINMAGAGSLPAGAIECTFRERSFDLRVSAAATVGKMMRLHIPILGEEISPESSLVKRKAGKLIVCLKKKENKGWYELRKTKGVGDSEYSKIVPDGGDPVEFSL